MDHGTIRAIMKHKIAAILFGTFVCSTVWAADSTVSDAIAKLKAADNYSWTVTTTVPPDAPFTPAPINGQTSSAGFVHYSTSFNDNTTDAVAKGTKVAYKGDNGWQLAAVTQDFSPDIMALNMAKNGAPAEEAALILKGVKEVKPLDGGAVGGDLTTEAVTDLMTFGPRGSKPVFPAPKNCKGSAKFWIKDGALVKYQTHMTGTASFNDTDTPLDFTRTTEIKDVGTTKTDIPDDAKKKL
jgi:hypothetical protein